MANFFNTIDDDDDEHIVAPEHLKKAITSEMDTIRGAMEVINLYVSHFMGTAGTVLNNSSTKKAENTSGTNS